MSLSGIIHHSHSFTRLKIYHHIYFIYHTFRHSNPSSMQDVCPMNAFKCTKVSIFYTDIHKKLTSSLFYGQSQLLVNLMHVLRVHETVLFLNSKDKNHVKQLGIYAT